MPQRRVAVAAAALALAALVAGSSPRRVGDGPEYLLDAAATRGARWWRTALGPIAAASCAAMLVAYRPSLPESYLSPPRLATFLWTDYP